jgi:predicted DNA-binding transcriptional regulator YafY
MSDRGTAGQQLERILFLLPLANREGGVSVTEAARTIGVPADTVRRDIEDISAREWYHPPGGADELQILLEAERVKIFSGNKFDRPIKLSQREALALSLGLRAAAADASGEDRERLRSLAHRLDMELAVASAEGLAERFSVQDDDGSGANLRVLLETAARARSRCRIRYLKPDDTAATEREIDPYVVVHGGSGWFVIGHCHVREDVLVFRFDRILEAAITDTRFEIPPTFDPAEYVEGGRVFRSDRPDEVLVRYSPVIAAWIREKGPCEELPEGSVSVRFPAPDPGWAVRHVLSHGPEAELVEPEEMRELVIRSARRCIALEPS